MLLAFALDEHEGKQVSDCLGSCGSFIQIKLFKSGECVEGRRFIYWSRLISPNRKSGLHSLSFKAKFNQISIE